MSTNNGLMSIILWNLTKKVLQRLIDLPRWQLRYARFCYDIQVAGIFYPGFIETIIFAHQTFDPIPHHSTPNFFTHRDSQAPIPETIQAVVDNKMIAVNSFAFLRQANKTRPFQDPFCFFKGISAQALLTPLHRQTFSPLGTTTVDNPSPLFCGHPFSKSVGPGSFDSAWLIGSFHNILFPLSSGCILCSN